MPNLVDVEVIEGKTARGECNGRPWSASFDDFGLRWTVASPDDFAFGERVAIAKAIRQVAPTAQASLYQERKAEVRELLATRAPQRLPVWDGPDFHAD